MNESPFSPPKTSRHLKVIFLLLALCLGLAVGWGWLFWQRPAALRNLPRGIAQWPLSEKVLPQRMTRPYGMAPVAFEAYIRACNNAGIHPFRIGQTIGDHPRSVGYHKRDGVLNINGERIEYCAAVDLGAFELAEWQRQKFLRALAKQGFAAWYRSGPRWKNGEHIHAIYALLPMKPQLRGQVEEWLSDRRRRRVKPLKWETRLRRRWGLRRF
ncbi:MAG TPA: hypothetical protein VF681_15180 [Abditibacteriaceae bacterium]|jgi:hypothetical protein